jgi:hypothetical protein
MEVEPEKLSPPGKAGSQPMKGEPEEAEPAGKGWRPKPMEAEPEKLSPPGKAGSQPMKGEPEKLSPPVEAGVVFILALSLFYF